MGGEEPLVEYMLRCEPQIIEMINNKNLPRYRNQGLRTGAPEPCCFHNKNQNLNGTAIWQSQKLCKY